MRKPLLKAPKQMRGGAADPAVERQARITQSGKTAIVHVFDYIDWLGFDVAFYGPQLDAMRDLTEIVVKINSPGGSAYDGVAFYNLLVQHPAKKIRTEVHGLAGSAASVIAMAGDEILMGTGARFFIHKPWGVIAGNDTILRQAADDLASMNEDFVDLYRQQAKKLSRDEILAIMAAETELSAADAVAKGFATGRLNKADEIKAAVDYGPIASSADVRQSLEQRHARLIRPHDDERPAISALKRRADLLKLGRRASAAREPRENQA